MSTVNDRLNAQADRITALERLTIDSRLKALEAKAHTHPLTDPVPPPVVTPPATTGNPAFLSRPAHAPYVVDGGSSVDISNVAIRGGTRDAVSGIGITIRNVAGAINLHDLDLSDLVGGIYLVNCTGTLTIRNVRSRNIGDSTIGSGHSNHVQLAECSLAGTIGGNEFHAGRTEDMVSIWHSGGRGAGQELVVENNVFVGLVVDSPTARAWTNGSGTGICVSDTDGPGYPKSGWVIVRNNTLLTPGQVGINLIDGPGLQVYGNVLYGEQRPASNNPMTSWAGNPVGVVRDNRWYWKHPDGSLVSPWFSGFGSISGNIGVQDPTIDPKALAGSL